MTDLTLFILLILSIFCIEHRNNQKRYIGFIFLFVCLCLLFGLRHYTVGTDSPNYAFRYESLSELSVFEPGFIWMMKGLHFFCPYYPFFFLVSASIIWGGLIRFYHRYTPLYWLAMFLFCAFGGVNTIGNNGIRQGIAIVFFLAAIPYALQKQWIGFFLWSILALSFHKSAIIVFPLYFLIQQKFKWWKILPLILVFAFILLHLEDITRFFFPNYERYLIEIESVNIGKLLQLTLISGFALWPLWYRYKNRSKISNIALNNMLLWFMPLYLLCTWGNYLSNVGLALGRLGWYFFPIVFLNLVDYLDTKSSKDKLIICLVLILLVFCYRFGVYYFSDMSDQVNIIYYYRFFWQ